MEGVPLLGMSPVYLLVTNVEVTVEVTVKTAGCFSGSHVGDTPMVLCSE